MLFRLRHRPNNAHQRELHLWAGDPERLVSSPDGRPVNTLSEPRSSFDGLIQTLYGDVAVTSQPMPKLDVRPVEYTIDDRDNQSTTQSPPGGSRSNTSTSANGDCCALEQAVRQPAVQLRPSDHHGRGGCRIFPETKVTLNETFETTYRSYANTCVRDREHDHRQGPQPNPGQCIQLPELFASGPSRERLHQWRHSGAAVAAQGPGPISRFHDVLRGIAQT